MTTETLWFKRISDKTHIRTDGTSGARIQCLQVSQLSAATRAALEAAGAIIHELIVEGDEAKISAVLQENGYERLGFGSDSGQVIASAGGGKGDNLGGGDKVANG